MEHRLVEDVRRGLRDVPRKRAVLDEVVGVCPRPVRMKSIERRKGYWTRLNSYFMIDMKVKVILTASRLARILAMHHAREPMCA